MYATVTNRVGYIIVRAREPGIYGLNHSLSLGDTGYRVLTITSIKVSFGVSLIKIETLIKQKRDT